MNSNIKFKKIHNRIGLYSNERLISELTIEEFENFCVEIRNFRKNNHSLFEEKLTQITVDDLNKYRYGDERIMGEDFTKNLLYINIRPIHFYKKDCSYLFVDLVYEENIEVSEPIYGIKGYDITSNNVVSISIENHNRVAIESGYVSNFYLRGLLDDEVVSIIKKKSDVKILINGEIIKKEDFIQKEKEIEYDTLFSDID